MAAPDVSRTTESQLTDTLGQFWPESFSQIYPTRKALQEAGHVRREGATGTGAFSITAAGVARLRDLLAEPFRPATPRDPLLLRLFFARHVGPELTRGRRVQALDAAVNRSEEFTRIRTKIEEQPGTPDAIYWLITLSAGEHAARARMAWAREALEMLDGVAADEGRSGP